MELESRIKALLQLEKFNNLSSQEKELVFNSILANCLILSKKDRDKFLSIVENNLVEIVNLKDQEYYKDGICYRGIVESSASGTPIDQDQTVFPFKFYLKYREYTMPLGKMTKSILHEFGHLVVKKPTFELKDDTYLIDMGGLVISKLLNDDYAHMLTEIINEFTNFLSYKAFLAYHTPNVDSDNKMKEFAEKMGLTVDNTKEYLRVLPDDLFSRYTEEALSSTTLEDGTDRMFNRLYVKYSPLVRLMMFTFQNPLFSYEDFKREFENENGLSSTINDVPVNDLFYSYYESSFHIQNLFDSIMGETGAWENFCIDFDGKMMDTVLDAGFIDSSVGLFTSFYQRRIQNMINNGEISEEKAKMKIDEYNQIVGRCKSYYDSIKDKSFK